MKRTMTYLCLLLLLCVSCTPSSQEQKKQTLPPSKGLPYELLLVVDDAIWNSEAGDSLRQVLQGNTPGLLQPEPMFRLLRITPKGYVRTYTTMRNKMFVRLNPEAVEPRVAVERNVEAVPQLQVAVEAKDTKALAAFIGRRADWLADQFVDMELTTEANRLQKKYNKKITAGIAAHVGFDVRIPEEIKSLKKRENFVWASSEQVEKDLNFVLYTYPWDGEALDLAVFVACRDSVLKLNIPGSRPDQWMTTAKEKEIPLAQAREIQVKGRNILEVRGFWEMHNGAFGGSFVSLAEVDSVRGEVVVAEGFVYSPRTECRDLVRRMEAVLRTVERTGGN